MNLAERMPLPALRKMVRVFSGRFFIIYIQKHTLSPFSWQFRRNLNGFAGEEQQQQEKKRCWKPPLPSPVRLSQPAQLPRSRLAAAPPPLPAQPPSLRGPPQQPCPGELRCPAETPPPRRAQPPPSGGGGGSPATKAESFFGGAARPLLGQRERGQRRGQRRLLRGRAVPAAGDR